MKKDSQKHISDQINIYLNKNVMILIFYHDNTFI